VKLGEIAFLRAPGGKTYISDENMTRLHCCSTRDLFVHYLTLPRRCIATVPQIRSEVDVANALSNHRQSEPRENDDIVKHIHNLALKGETNYGVWRRKASRVHALCPKLSPLQLIQILEDFATVRYFDPSAVQALLHGLVQQEPFDASSHAVHGTGKISYVDIQDILRLLAALAVLRDQLQGKEDADEGQATYFERVVVPWLGWVRQHVLVPRVRYLNAVEAIRTGEALEELRVCDLDTLLALLDQVAPFLHASESKIDLEHVLRAVQLTERVLARGTGEILIQRLVASRAPRGAPCVAPHPTSPSPSLTLGDGLRGRPGSKPSVYLSDEKTADWLLGTLLRAVKPVVERQQGTLDTPFAVKLLFTLTMLQNWRASTDVLGPAIQSSGEDPPSSKRPQDAPTARFHPPPSLTAPLPGQQVPRRQIRTPYRQATRDRQELPVKEEFGRLQATLLDKIDAESMCNGLVNPDGLLQLSHILSLLAQTQGDVRREKIGRYIDPLCWGILKQLSLFGFPQLLAMLENVVRLDRLQLKQPDGYPHQQYFVDQLRCQATGLLTGAEPGLVCRFFAVLLPLHPSIALPLLFDAHNHLLRALAELSSQSHTSSIPALTATAAPSSTAPPLVHALRTLHTLFCSSSDSLLRGYVNASGPDVPRAMYLEAEYCQREILKGIVDDVKTAVESVLH